MKCSPSPRATGCVFLTATSLLATAVGNHHARFSKVWRVRFQTAINALDLHPYLSLWRWNRNGCRWRQCLSGACHGRQRIIPHTSTSFPFLRQTAQFRAASESKSSPPLPLKLHQRGSAFWPHYPKQTNTKQHQVSFLRGVVESVLHWDYKLPTW